MSGLGRTSKMGQNAQGAGCLRESGAVLRSVMPLSAAVLGRLDPEQVKRAQAPVTERQIVELVVYGPDRQVVAGAEVTYINTQMIQSDIAVTDQNGRALLTVPAGCGAEAAELVVEAKGYWGRRILSPVLHPIAGEKALSNAVVLTTLAGPAVDSVSWGLEAMGLDTVPSVSFLGQRAGRCALILSEVGCHQLGQPFVYSGVDALQRAKVRGLSETTAALAGLLCEAAPEAEVTIIPLPLRPTVAEAIAALDWCMEHGVDVACLCVASAAWDDCLQAALRRAKRAGVLVICPAGDGSAALSFPAACEDVLTVAAVGHKAASPKGSAHVALNGVEGRDGFCLSNLAIRTDGIDLVAPGIAVVADDLILSGSALAAVHVTGFALCLLHADERLQRQARSGVRLLDTTSAILAHCLDLCFAPGQQGAGMPVWGMKGRAHTAPKAEAQLAKGAQAAMDLIAMGLS